MSGQHARTALAFVAMHPNRRRDLEERFGGPEALLEVVLAGKIKLPDHARLAATVPADDRTQQLVEAEIDLIFKGSKQYPASLAALPDAPDSLFVRGALSTEPRVGIVGSRAATSYGLRCALAIGVALSAAGYLVVSGLAKGIDARAHRGALDASCTPTWAVLGCGIDRWYPKVNARLGEEIIEKGGAIISEYPPGTPPSGWRFPPRNRIISGLSRAVVVVEATVKGGALITARHALEHAVDVLAVPGDIDRATSAGCNLLIADGAVPVTAIEDVVEVMQILSPTNRAAVMRTYSLEEIAGQLDESLTAAGVQAARWEMAGVVKRQGEIYVGPSNLLG